MYYAIVAALMFLLPLVSLVTESLVSAIPLGAPLVAKWFFNTAHNNASQPTVFGSG
jgi:hypothetical protein